MTGRAASPDVAGQGSRPAGPGPDRRKRRLSCLIGSRYGKAGGRFIVCPVCFSAKQFDKDGLSAPIAATTPAGSGSGGVVSGRPAAALH